MRDPAPPAGRADPDEPGGAAPVALPPMPRRPPPVRRPTVAQSRLVARAGLVLTLVLAAAGVTGVVWLALAATGVR